MTDMERLSVHTGGESPLLHEALLAEAEAMILAYTGRGSLIAPLQNAKIQLAAVLHARRGIEGQSAHSEGGVSRTLEGLPEGIRRQIAPYRLARIVRVSHAAE